MKGWRSRRGQSARPRRSAQSSHVRGWCQRSPVRGQLGTLSMLGLRAALAAERTTLPSVPLALTKTPSHWHRSKQRQAGGIHPPVAGIRLSWVRPSENQQATTNAVNFRFSAHHFGQ